MWDMPITIEIADLSATSLSFKKIFDYFEHVDDVFNIFKEQSEISKINRNEIPHQNWSEEMKEVLVLCEKTRRETYGFFNHNRGGFIDPLGLVKGWAIQKGAEMLKSERYDNFFIDAGGDIQVSGNNSQGEPWTVGIRNPFNRFENVKILALTDCGIATSGTYIRGNHIFNPFKPKQTISDAVSLTVIGHTVYEADRFATAAFVMGKQGIHFIEQMKGLEGYMIDSKGIATYTSGFEKFVKQEKINSLFIYTQV